MKRKRPRRSSKRSSRAASAAVSAAAPENPFPDLTRRDLHELYRLMRLTRSVEERLTILYKQGKLYGSLFRSLGQEATAVGAAYALQEGDILYPLIRDLGAALARGFTPKDVFAQYLCREQSTCRGRDGIHHVGDMGRGVISMISMLGSNIPVAAGAAWARNRQGGNAVALTFIGDGGTSTGEFHEAVNLAAVMDLPLILVIENNQWAYSTPVSRQARVRDLAVRAQGYGIPGWVVDGNDPVDVLRAVRRGAEHGRAGRGPVLIEAKTYRIKGHAEHDSAGYVPADELQAWAARDPVESFRGRLVELGFLTEEEERAMRAQIDESIREGEEAALALSLPPPESVLQGVFADDSIVRFTPWWESH